MTEFNDISVKYTKSKDTKFLKENGIYFTPKTFRDIAVNSIKPYIKKNCELLEPSCGSGEFIRDLLPYQDYFNITGVELDKELFNISNQLNATIINDDFLKPNLFDKKFDIIIGNPPYFELKKTILF